MKNLLAYIAAVAAALAVVLIAPRLSGDDAPKADRSSEVNTPVVDEDPTPEPLAFTKEDFNLRLKILDKQCYGSAGCNVTYKVVPVYAGTDLSDLDGQTIDVTYRVTGPESPEVHTISFDGASYDQEDFSTSTPPNPKLKAAVIRVETF